jgi:hypothetical protein
MVIYAAHRTKTYGEREKVKQEMDKSKEGSGNEAREKERWT